MSATKPDTSPSDAEKTSTILADLRASGEPEPESAELSSLAAPPARRVSTQTIIVALVLVISGAALFLMRKQGMNAGIHFDRAVTIEKDLTKVKSAPVTPAQQRILADLIRSRDLAPVPGEKIQKNPFRLDAKPAAEGALIPMATADNTPAILAALGGLKLNGIMQGPVPLARVNGNTVRVGDIISEWFVVAQIHERSIDLIAENKTYTLGMGDAAPSSGHPRR
jgi:hypothetical protein